MEVVPIVAALHGRVTCTQDRPVGEGKRSVKVGLDRHPARDRLRGRSSSMAMPTAASARRSKDFADAAVRPASHAGGAYHDDPAEACRIHQEGTAWPPPRPGRPPPPPGRPPLRRRRQAPPFALVFTHIDPWRGAVCLWRGVQRVRCRPPDAETFILGYDRAPMPEPFALCQRSRRHDARSTPGRRRSTPSRARANSIPMRISSIHKARALSARDSRPSSSATCSAKRPARIVPILAGPRRAAAEHGRLPPSRRR